MEDPNKKFLEGLSAEDEQDMLEAEGREGSPEFGASGDDVAAEDLRQVGVEHEKDGA